MAGDPWSEHQCRCERCGTLREASRDAAWIVLCSEEPDYIKQMAWDTKHVVGQLIEALHRQHVPECYTERFGEERKTGLGYLTPGEDVVMGDDEEYDHMDEDTSVQKGGEQQGPSELEQGLREPALTDEESAIVLDDQAEGGKGEVKRNLTEWESAKVLAAQEEKDARVADRTAYFAQMQASYEANGPLKNDEVNPRHELRICRWYGGDVLW
ncbi:hypothetical protein LTR27_005416 [Elasticomyces elasticus]|nr:hypothetical protein LTR27_005416 [Elasticomyces elasticus]